MLVFLISPLFAGNEGKAIYGGEKKSLILWDQLNPNKWLDYYSWRREVAIKDQTPDWESRLREGRRREFIGRFLECDGVCRVYRGKANFKAQYRSGLDEGDEVFTEGDSYGWIFLLDGTLIRMSPKSSITLKEINIGTQENFLHIRINSGNILWLSRKESAFKENNFSETDTLFYPLAFYEANPASDPDTENIKEDNLFSFLKDDQKNILHMKELNRKIKENNNFVSGKKTYSYIVMPNGTLSGFDMSAEFIVLLGGASYFKQRGPEQLGHKDSKVMPLTFFYRGLENKKSLDIDGDRWYQVGQRGRVIEKHFDDKLFAAGEYLTKRITSFYVAREILLNKYSHFIFDENISGKELAETYGYRRWGKMNKKEDDLYLRLQFLQEYTRRSETTGLLSLERFKLRVFNKDETLTSSTYGRFFFTRALNSLIRSREVNEFSETGREELNSTKKKLWKRLNAIK